jgi:hypothetical protein
LWVGSHIDHQLISKDVSSSDDTPVEGIKEAQDRSTPSIGDSPNPIPTLDGSNSKIAGINGTSNITKHPKRKLETPRKLAKKEALDSPDSGKVR